MLENYGRRDSNWELLRILSMLAIVAGHFVGQTKALEYIQGIDLIFALIFGSASRIAVALFLFLGTWYMVDAKFSAKRILKLYGEYAFYSISITLIMVIITDVPIKDIVNGLFPGIKGGLWFAHVYFYLLLIAPFLKKVLNIDKNLLKLLLIVLFFAIFLKWNLVKTSQDNFVDAYIFFIYTFLIMGYYKKYLFNKININHWISLFIGIIIYIILVGILYFAILNDKDIIVKIIRLYLGDYKTIPNLLISIPIFYFFQKLNIGKIKFINFISKSAFAVYLIHQVEAFYPYMWSNIFKCSIGIKSDYFIIYMIGVVISIYVLASIIDYFRIKYIEPVYLNSKICKNIELNLNKIYSNIDK